LTTYAGITPSANIQTLLGSADYVAARTNLGLGTIATQNSNSVSITGGSITGITDLAVADGGTGASTAAGARTNLGLGTTDAVDFGDASLALLQLDQDSSESCSSSGDYGKMRYNNGVLQLCRP